MTWNLTELWNPTNGFQPIELLLMTWLLLFMWFLTSRRFWSERRSVLDALMFIPSLLWEYADWGYWFIEQRCYNGKIPERDKNDAIGSTIMLLALMFMNFGLWSAIF